MIYDHVVVGGGIVGASTARHLLAAAPGSSLLLLDKERAFGLHQTGHNSGVIHSGIYYAPGSLKAEMCRRGARLTEEYAAARGIPVERTGKLLVATTTPRACRARTPCASGPRSTGSRPRSSTVPSCAAASRT